MDATNAPRSETRFRSLAAVFALVGLLCVAAAYAWTGYRAWNCDPHVYAVAARGVLQGESLYRTTWQDKPPVSLLAYAIPEAIAPGSPVAMQLFLFVLVLMQSTIVLTLAPCSRSMRWIVAWMLLLLPFLNFDFVPLLTEHIANVFIVWNLMVAYRIVARRGFSWWELLSAGAATAFAFNARQNMVLSGALPLIAAVAAPGTWRSRFFALWLLGLGAVAGFAMVLGVLFAVGGDWRGYLYTTIEYPGRYAAAGGDAWRRLQKFGGFLNHFISSPSFILLVLPVTLLRAPSQLLLCILAALGLGFGCMLPFKQAGHYWINMFPVIALCWLALDSESSFSHANVRRLGIAVVAYLAINVPSTGMWVLRNWHEMSCVRDVAAAVDRVAGPDGTVFAFGRDSHMISYFSRHRPANTYFCHYQLNSYHRTLLPISLDQIVRDYVATPPQVVAFCDREPGEALPAEPETTEIIWSQLQARYKYVLGPEQRPGWTIFVREASGG